MDNVLALLGDEIEDVSEETFDLFSQSLPSQDLGMLDPKASAVEITIAGRDFTLIQSPGVLQSDRSGGTTGAAVWRTSVRFAEWLASPSNLLFQQGLLGASSAVLELGSGISGLTASVLAPKVARFVATDQQYALKMLRSNIDNNLAPVSRPRKVTKNKSSSISSIDVLPLDWETDDVPSFLSATDLGSGVDVVLASDCIYNYALIEPFTQACVDICRVRQPTGNVNHASNSTLCVIAQQLRQPDVLEQWLETLLRSFRVWRVPSTLLGEGLDESSGFCVHFGVLR